MARKKKITPSPDIHKDLQGFNIKINEFGEIKSTFSIEKLNSFLNEKVDDKKINEIEDDIKG